MRAVSREVSVTEWGRILDRNYEHCRAGIAKDAISAPAVGTGNLFPPMELIEQVARTVGILFNNLKSVRLHLDTTMRISLLFLRLGDERRLNAFKVVRK